jgi:DNA polymerase (family 10)
MWTMTNATIADRLAAFAILLELAEANPYSIRAYRRAAELVRVAPAPVADLVREGRVRELRGIGPAIEGKLHELVTTGRIAELDELERTVSPEIAGLGRYLGLGARRALDIARALDLRSADEFRRAIEDGLIHEAPGVGPKTVAQLEVALARPPSDHRRSLLLTRATELLERIAGAVDGSVAGDVRRCADAPARLAVVAAADDPEPVVVRFAAVPEVVAILERDGRRAVGVTTDGLPLELVVAEPERKGTELLRATGSPAYVAALEPLPDAPTEQAVYEALGIPFCPPELREEPFRGEPPRLLEIGDIRGDLHCHTTWSDGRATVRELGEAARARGYEYVAVCDHTPNVRVVPGVTGDDLRRQGEEISAANEKLAPFRILRGAECDILPDGSLDLPDDILAELDWVTASLHAGQRTPGPELTRRVTEAMRHPAVRALSHPTGRLIGYRPPNALDLEETIAVALETGVALEVNGLPRRLDLSGEHVRQAITAGARIVVNTDAHSTQGLGNIELAVATARRGWATAADVVNTRSLDELLAHSASD